MSQMDHSYKPKKRLPLPWKRVQQWTGCVGGTILLLLGLGFVWLLWPGATTQLTRWETFTGPNVSPVVSAILVTPDGRVYAGTDRSLFRSDDGEDTENRAEREHEALAPPGEITERPPAPLPDLHAYDHEVDRADDRDREARDDGGHQ